MYYYFIAIGNNNAWQRGLVGLLFWISERFWSLALGCFGTIIMPLILHLLHESLLDLMVLLNFIRTNVGENQSETLLLKILWICMGKKIQVYHLSRPAEKFSNHDIM